jgi:hypothetical protein
MSFRALQGILLLILLGFAGCGPTHVAEDLTAPVVYARVKKPTAVIAHRSELPAGMPQPYPEYGVVIEQGNFFAPGPTWMIVDFDTQSVTRLDTMRADVAPKGDQQETRIAKVVRPMSDA